MIFLSATQIAYDGTILYPHQQGVKNISRKRMFEAGMTDKDLPGEVDLPEQEAKIYKEYEFIYETNESRIHGIIDLMLEYKDHIDIIDYKLSNIQDEAYIKQLATYKAYIETKTNKQVNLYLYSIMQSTYQKLEV